MDLRALNAQSVRSNTAAGSEGTPDDAKPIHALTGGTLWPEIQISTPSTPEAERYNPAVAYNPSHNEYLVVWQNTVGNLRSISARRLSGSGQPMGDPFPICPDVTDISPRSCLQPAVAANAWDDEYLIVYMYDENGDGSKYDIAGRIIRWDGTPVTPKFIIWRWDNRNFWTPRVVWSQSGNQYMVIWNAVDAKTGEKTDVAGVHVSAAGVPDAQAHLLAFNGQVMLPSYPGPNHIVHPEQADIAFDYNPAGNVRLYLVVLRALVVEEGRAEIFYLPLYPDGSIMGNYPQRVSVSTDSMHPAVASSGFGHFFLLWQQRHSFTNWFIQAEEREEHAGTTGMIALDNKSVNAGSTAVAALQRPAREYLLVRQISSAAGESIWGNRCTSAGTPVCGPDFTIATGAFWNAEKPAVAASRRGMMVVYEGDSAGDPTIHRHIYGRLWWPPNLWLPLITR